MKLPRKPALILTLIITTFLFVGLTQTGLAQESGSVEEKIAQLQKAVDELKERIPRIGYINRKKAFSVFPRAVEEERRKVNELETKMEDFNARAQEGEIGESEFKRQRDLLRAKHLQARIEVDLALLDTMIEARGFAQIQGRLKELRGQTEPMEKTVADLIDDINNYAVSPEQVSKTLEEVGSQQFESLDNILTNLAQSKITQVAQRIAAQEDFDLVIEQQNVILYRKKETIVDMTDDVMQALNQELKPE